MRLLIWSLAALAAAAAPATAGTMLYATAATPGRIHGFCVGPNGALAGTPRVEVDTVGQYPSRLRVSATTRTLYVAENDRVEVFAIGTGGSLSRPTPSHVPLPVQNGTNSRDIALDCADGDTACVPTLLYVPERAFGRISAFRLDPTTGLPASQSSESSVEDSGVEFEGLLYNPAVSPRLLYASQIIGDEGAVVAYPLCPDGRLGGCIADDPNDNDDPDDCNVGENPADHPEDTDGICDDDVTKDETEVPTPGSLADDDGVPLPCASPVACEVPPASDPPTCPAPVTCPSDSFVCQPEAGGRCLCCRKVASQRRNIPGAGAMVLRENPEGIVSECNPAPSPFRLYVEARFNQQLVAYNLDASGNFDVKRFKKREGDPNSCLPKTKGEPPEEIPRQRASTKTDEGIRHQDLAVAGEAPRITILGSQFGDGRVDGYRLNKKNRLTGQPSRTTRKDVRTSPVRMLVRDIALAEDDPATADDERQLNQVLYVAAGQYDRVQAYRLRATGLPATKNPFSETAPIGGSFPNDIALVDVQGACD